MPIGARLPAEDSSEAETGGLEVGRGVESTGGNLGGVRLRVPELRVGVEFRVDEST